METIFGWVGTSASKWRKFKSNTRLWVRRPFCCHRSLGMRIPIPLRIAQNSSFSHVSNLSLARVEGAKHRMRAETCRSPSCSSRGGRCFSCAEFSQFRWFRVEGKDWKMIQSQIAFTIRYFCFLKSERREYNRKWDFCSSTDSQPIIFSLVSASFQGRPL